MRKPQLTRELQRIPGARSTRGGAPFADAVERQDGGFLEGARKKGAGGVAFVMLEEQQLRA